MCKSPKTLHIATTTIVAYRAHVKPLEYGVSANTLSSKWFLKYVYDLSTYPLSLIFTPIVDIAKSYTLTIAFLL